MADAPATTDTSTDPTDTTTADPTDATSDLGDAGKKAIAAERARADAAVKANKALEARLKAIEDKDKSDLEKANEAATTAAKERDDARRDAMRLKVGVDKRLPAEIVELLQGDTQEEMSAHADRLSAVVKQATRPTGSIDAGRVGDAVKRGPAQEFADFIKAQTGA